MINLMKYRNNILISLFVFVCIFFANRKYMNVNEGIENKGSTKKEDTNNAKIDKLTKEMDELKLELAVSEKKVKSEQKTMDALNGQIQIKQTEIDKIQNLVDIDNLNKSM